MGYTLEPIQSRPHPIRVRTWRSWVRSNLFSSLGNGFVSVLLLILLVFTVTSTIQWAVVNAVVDADAAACQAVRGIGACWGVINEKARIILFGRYPHGEHWRAALATALLLGLVGLSCGRIFWKGWLPILWLVILGTCFVLMGGGVLGLSAVSTDRWGGLPLTVMLTVISVVAAFPIAVAVALGRRSGIPVLSFVCMVYVELIRGLPLISVLFMASFMFPLLLPVGTPPDVLLRVIVGITLFAAAYLAEVVRGGLQAIPQGQTEAAASLNLGYWHTQIAIILPQALAISVPSIMNSVISLFKNTSLVAIVSLYDLTGAFSLAMNGQPSWRPFKLEAYLFIAFIYFACCFGMSRYSLYIERRLAASKVHQHKQQ